MILAVSLIACILISLLIAVVTGYFIRSASLKKWEELPRKRGAEAVLGLLALLFSSFFAFMCFVVGTIGIFISAKPHWMRDWIRKIAASTKWRIVSTAVPLLFAIASLILVIQLKGVL